MCDVDGDGRVAYAPASRSWPQPDEAAGDGRSHLARTTGRADDPEGERCRAKAVRARARARRGLAARANLGLQPSCMTRRCLTLGARSESRAACLLPLRLHRWVGAPALADQQTRGVNVTHRRAKTVLRRARMPALRCVRPPCAQHLTDALLRRQTCSAHVSGTMAHASAQRSERVPGHESSPDSSEASSWHSGRRVSHGCCLQRVAAISVHLGDVDAAAASGAASRPAAAFAAPGEVRHARLANGLTRCRVARPVLTLSRRRTTDRGRRRRIPSAAFEGRRSWRAVAGQVRPLDQAVGRAARLIGRAPRRNRGCGGHRLRRAHH
jgi:hypothetical protein